MMTKKKYKSLAKNINYETQCILCDEPLKGVKYAGEWINFLIAEPPAYIGRCCKKRFTDYSNWIYNRLGKKYTFKKQNLYGLRHRIRVENEKFYKESMQLLKEGEHKGVGTVKANKFPDQEMYANDNKKIISLLEQQLVEMKAIKEAVSYLVSIIRKPKALPEEIEMEHFDRIPRY